MELSVNNITYLSEPKAVRNGEDRPPRRDREKKNKKGGEEQQREPKGFFIVDLKV